MIATYDIQHWLFQVAPGRYDFDLAESGVQFQCLGDLKLESSWGLDYSLDRGIPELRRSIGHLYGVTETGITSLVTHGAQEALYLLYRSLLESGDHVIVTAPGWQQAWEVPQEIGCEVSVVEWTPGARFDVAALARTISARTRLLVLNSPCNPSGCRLTQQEWDAVVELAEAHGIWLVNDEEYLLDFADSVLHKYSRAVSVSGLSKVYGLPALRIGWAAGPQSLIERMVNYKRYTTVSNSVVWETVAVQVLAERAKHVERYLSLTEPGLAALRAFAEDNSEHLSLVTPAGTPFAWLHTDLPLSSQAFAEHLLDKERLLVMPAEVFGSRNGVRLSFARPLDLLEEGLERVRRALADVG